MLRTAVCLMLAAFVWGCALPAELADANPDATAGNDVGEATNAPSVPAADHGGDESTSDDESIEVVAPQAAPATPREAKTEQSSAHIIALGEPAARHADGYATPLVHCATCHGAELQGTGVIPDCPECYIPACTDCHGAIWSTGSLPADHDLVLGADAVPHRAGLLTPETACARCHGSGLAGAGIAPSCTTCHGAVWDLTNGVPASHTQPKGPAAVPHAPGALDPAANCAACHGAALQGAGSTPACLACHGALWGGELPGDHTRLLGYPGVPHKPEIFAPASECATCHGSTLAGSGVVPGCTACHGTVWTLVNGVPVSHDAGLGPDDVLHKPGYDEPEIDCAACHALDSADPDATPSCTSCHSQIWAHVGIPADHAYALGAARALHKQEMFMPLSDCIACHGFELGGAGVVPSCRACHGDVWRLSDGVPISHDMPLDGVNGVYHRDGLFDPEANCVGCHGADLQGSLVAGTCFACHGRLWSAGDHWPPSHSEMLSIGDVYGAHPPDRTTPEADCVQCHQADLNGTRLITSCWVCHGSIWDGPPDYPPTHTRSKEGYYHAPGWKAPMGKCDECHGTDLRGTPLIPSCYACHGNEWNEK